jgi:hypothetical protein
LIASEDERRAGEQKPVWLPATEIERAVYASDLAIT